MVRNATVSLAGAALVWIALCFSAFGQEVAKAPPTASLDQQDVAPSPLSSASVSFYHTQDGELEHELRTTLIHQSAKGGGVYFVRPPFANRLRKKPIEGFPAFVSEVDWESDANGHILLVIWTKLFSPELKNLARDAVLNPAKGERANALRDGRTEDDIDIRPWPLKHLIAIIRNKNSKEVLAAAESSSLTGKHEDLELAYKFTPENLEKFLQCARMNRLEFVYFYTYKGVKLAEGDMIAKGEVNVHVVFDEVLTSEQKEGVVPVFQSQRAEVVRKVAMRRSKIIRGNPKVIPFLDTDEIGTKVFEPAKLLSVEELKSLNPEAIVQLAKYLKPHIETLKKNLAKSNVEVKTHESGESNSEQSGFGFSFLGIGASGTNENVKHELDRFQQESGVLMQEAGSTERYVPHQVSVSFLRKGQENIQFDDHTAVCFYVGEDSSYLEDSPVNANFTESLVTSNTIRQDVLDPYYDFPLGTILPFVGTKVPKGYLLVDPKSVWPVADWVPVQLRGKNMPDLSRLTLFGTIDLAAIGEGKADGTFNVSENLLIAEAGIKNRNAKPPKDASNIIYRTFGMDPGNSWHNGFDDSPEVYLTPRGKGYEDRDPQRPRVVPLPDYGFEESYPTGKVTGKLKLGQIDNVLPHFRVRWIVRCK